MEQESLDLFPETERPVWGSPAAAGLRPKHTPSLEQVMTESGRKSAFKALTPDLATDLEGAVALVSLAKRVAYDKACAGEILNSFGWASSQPGLASATAVLSRSFIETDAIPMAWNDASA